MLNLIGQRFGKWTVLERDDNYNKEHNLKGKDPYWKCQCDCGIIKSVNGRNLKKGRSLSCGCGIKKDLKGKTFGKLFVLEDSGLRSNRGAIMWKCQCECGSIVNVRSSHLLSGEIYSCGCIISKGEEKIAQLLTQNNIPFEKQKTFSSCVNPKTNYSLSFDFYINNSFLLEFDGQQHYRWDNYGWNTKENYNKTKERDNYKNQWCKDNNIILKRIPYWRLEKLTIKEILSNEFEVK
jgi:hypothetical protein